MGSGNSHHLQQPTLLDHQQQLAMMSPHEIAYQQPPQPQYPDMNQIFKGIPKMMQVADDMHRMTNYMQDLRNMMFFCSILSLAGLFFFLLLRFLQNRKSTKRRRRAHNNRTDESEQSSLSISRPSNYRHYHSSRPVDNWTHKIEMDRMIDSTSTRHTNVTHHGTPGGSHVNGHHGLLLNNKPALLSGSQQQLLATNSPEHQQAQQNHYHNSSPLHEGAGGSARDISPAATPTSSAGPPPLHLQAQQPNGQLKRLDPVKLVVDEMPYMDNEHEH